MASSARRQVTERELQAETDWSNKTYELGIRRPDGKHEGLWNPLERADLEVLSKLLRTALPLRAADGSIELVRAIDESDELRHLADWAHAAADYMRRNGL